jgi:peroxiredoxin
MIGTVTAVPALCNAAPPAPHQNADASILNPGAGPILNTADEKEMACKELVDVLTDYLDGSLPRDDRQRLEAHLDECPYCVDYLAQMKETIAAIGGARLESLAAGRTAMAETLELAPGGPFPDLDLPDHTGRPRTLSELAGGDPLVLFSSRGWWCPKEQRYMRELSHVQDEFEVAYARIVVLSVDSPEVQSAFRAGLGARFTFLSDSERRWLKQLPLCEGTDTLHDPYRPAAFTLFPDLTIHAEFNGYWYWGRATMEELRQEMRAITREVREDWEVPES